MNRAGLARSIWYRQGFAGLPLWVWLAVDVLVGLNIGALIGNWLELRGIGTFAVMLLVSAALSWWAIKVVVRREPQ